MAMILNSTSRRVILFARPCTWTAVRCKGYAKWRQDPDILTLKLASLEARLKVNRPFLWKMLDIANTTRVGTMSLAGDLYQIGYALVTGGLKKSRATEDYSNIDRSDLLALRRVHLTLRQCGFMIGGILIPLIGNLIAIFVLTKSHKFLTPYFWNDAAHQQFMLTNFSDRADFYRLIVRDLLASKLTDPAEKLAIQRAVDGDFSCLQDLVATFAMKFPLSSLAPEHVISLARSWNLWKISTTSRVLLPVWYNRWQLQRYLRLVLENDRSVLLLGSERLSADDHSYCWSMKGYPLIDRNDWPYVLEKSARVSSTGQELSVVAHMNILIALGIDARRTQKR